MSKGATECKSKPGWQIGIPTQVPRHTHATPPPTCVRLGRHDEVSRSRYHVSLPGRGAADRSGSTMRFCNSCSQSPPHHGSTTSTRSTPWGYSSTSHATSSYSSMSRCSTAKRQHDATSTDTEHEQNQWKRPRRDEAKSGQQVQHSHQAVGMSQHPCKTVQVENSPIVPRHMAGQQQKINDLCRRHEGGLEAADRTQESLPSSPCRFRSGNSYWWSTDVDARLDCAKQRDFRIQLEQLLQPYEWRQMAYAVDTTRRARYLGGHACMWPGRARENLDKKWECIERVHKEAASGAIKKFSRCTT